MPLRSYIVEDNAVVRARLTETLQEVAGVVVIGYEAGAIGASDWLVGHLRDWDLAIVDLMLSDGSGLAVIDATQKRSDVQRVIVLSDCPSAPMREKCRVLGADRVFDLSTQVDELIAYCSLLAKPC